MKKIVLALGVSVLALSAPAMARSGFYMGLGVIQSDNSRTVKHVVPDTGYFVTVNANAISAAPVDALSNDGFGASIYGGYRHDFDGSMVFGAIEVDANVYDGEMTRNITSAYPGYACNPSGCNYTIEQTLSQQWNSTVRARLGLTVAPGWEPFITGGLAVTDIEFGGRFSDNCTFATGCAFPAQGAKSGGTKTGFVYGGGLDVGLGGSTKLRIEYQRQEFDDLAYSRTLTRTIATPTTTLSGTAKDITNDMVRVGLTWDIF